MEAAYPLDLHVHSTFSDGRLSPAQLCAEAARQGIELLSLCDHDTLSGLEPMAQAARENSLTFVPSVELGSGPSARLHMLGYGVNPACDELQDLLRRLAAQRRERMQKMLALLARQGVRIDPTELPPSASSGRAHLAAALVRHGAAGSVAEAFDRFLAEGRCAYVPRTVPTAAQATALLRRAKAVPVLAHPVRLGLSPGEVHALVRELKTAGLAGVEAYHPSANPEEARRLESMARAEGLLVTGGSDFHGDGTHARMGYMPEGWVRAPQDARALCQAVNVSNKA